MKRTASGYIVYYSLGYSLPLVWHVECLATETPESLKKHLLRWQPEAEFVGAIIVPDEEENHEQDQASEGSEVQVQVPEGEA